MDGLYGAIHVKLQLAPLIILGQMQSKHGTGGQMDKELIAMCDCEEIQGRWEPKVGDRVLAESEQEWTEAIITDVRIRTVGLAYLNNFHLWVQTECCIYIPRIEDVLEWLISEHHKTWRSVFDVVAEFRGKWNSAIKALLAHFMRLEYNKSWSGEAWV